MSQAEKPKPPATPRQKTPRIPANVLYDRIIPIVLVIIGVVLVIVLAVVILGAGQP